MSGACPRKRTLLATLGTSALAVAFVNAIFWTLHSAQLDRAIHRHHHHWFNLPEACTDFSEHCASWAQAGGCRWDWMTQNVCKLTCNRCMAESMPFYDTHPFLGILGFKDMADTMKYKVESAQVSHALDSARDKIHRVNHMRLSQARINPSTCQPSDTHGMGQGLSHFGEGMVFPSSVQAACKFSVEPVRPPAECEDASSQCKEYDLASCMGSDFMHMLHSCPRTCGFCGGGTCTDKHGSCHDWSLAGQCRSNAVYMTDTCPSSCKICTKYYDRVPPAFTTLYNGLLMPTIGFGTAGLGENTLEAVKVALKVGYRHLDSAQGRQWYREDMTAEAFLSSGILRDDVFLTTKIHPQDLGYQQTIDALEISLRAFKTDYMDLVLLHYPECFSNVCTQQPKGTWQDSWKALEELVKQGKVLTIGVSNFNLQQLMDLVTVATVPPAVVQRRNDVFEQDIAIRHFCMLLGIQYVAYSSLGTQYMHGGFRNPVLTSDVIRGIASDAGASEAQVVLKYALGSGQVVIPRSRSEAHMEESLNLGAVRFTAQHLTVLQNLNGRLKAHQ